MSNLQYSDQEEEISEFVSLMMNILGYSNKRTKERIEALNILSKACDIQTKHITHQPEYEKKIVGSLREGISLFGISDFDTLQIDRGVVCTANGSTVDGKVTFHMETDGVPQGYCHLKLQHNGHNEAYQRLKHALVEQTNGTYLSSSAYTNLNDDIYKYGDGFSSHNVKYLPKTGPSIPRRNAVYQLIQNLMQISGLSCEQDILSGLDYNTDVVHALPCIQGTILDNWGTRNRLSGWPNKDMVSKVIDMQVYIVPVGCKGTQNENLQWQISFVEAELYLVQSLNDTQRKVLILAKHITKKELKPISKHMKSYLVKMAVLWLAEKVPEAEFRQQHLMARLKDVLLFLKTSIENQFLPHYIVSGRNLLEGKLLHGEYNMLISKLEDTIDIINKCVIREMGGDKSEEILMNNVKCALVNIMTINMTNDIRRKTPEELANSFMNKFKCQSSWSYLFYSFKDDFSFLYRNLGHILRHWVVPFYTEAQLFCFIVNEALGEEQSDTEGNDEALGEEQSETEGNNEALGEEQSETEGNDEALGEEHSETEGNNEALGEEQSNTEGNDEALSEEQSDTEGNDEALGEEQSEGNDEALGEEQSETEGNNEALGEEQSNTEGNDEALGEEQSETEGNNEAISEEQSNTEGNNEAVFVQQRDTEGSDETRKESLLKIQQHNNTLLMLTENLANMYLMFFIIPTLSLLTYYNYESIILVYIFWFLFSFLKKNCRKKAMLTRTLICIIYHCYNFYTDDSILMENFFTIAPNDTCTNATVPIAPYKILVKLAGSVRFISNEMNFMSYSLLPYFLDDFIRFEISSGQKTG